jgi:hypothetical protein
MSTDQEIEERIRKIYTIAEQPNDSYGTVARISRGDWWVADFQLFADAEDYIEMRIVKLRKSCEEERDFEINEALEQQGEYLGARLAKELSYECRNADCHRSHDARGQHMLS